MAEEIYRYRAFISYRHVERDRKWARWLIEKLETFRTPRALVDNGAPLRIGRLFRDDDEIPASSDLSHQIEDALRASQFLIVVCSRDTPQSTWVRREIEFFRSIGRGNRILVLLVDGEPNEAFPPELLRVAHEHTAPDGTRTTEWVDEEPIAADVRPRTDERKSATERRAFLRIASGLLGVSFDDLARREHQRRLRRQRLVAGAASLAIAGIALAGYIATSAIQKADRATRVSQYLSAAQAALRNANTEAAVQSAASAYAIDPNSETRSMLYFALSHLSPHLAQRVSLGSQAVKALAWSKDGTLAIATSTGAAYFETPARNATSLTQIVKPPARRSGIIFISFASSGALNAVFANGALAEADRQSRTWRLAPVTTAAAYGAAIDDKNNELVVVPIAASPLLVRCSGAIATAASRCASMPLAASYGSAVSINAKSGDVAIGDRNGDVAIYTHGSTQPSFHLPAGAPVISLSWDQNRDWLAAGLANGAVLIEDAQTRSQRGRYASGQAVVSAVAFNPTSDLLAFSCRARAVCVADAVLVQATPHLLVLKGHGNVVTHLAWSSDGERLASSDEDNSVIIWNQEPSRDVLFDAEPFGPGNIAALATSPGGDRLAVARADGYVSVWDTKALVSQSPHTRHQIANFAGRHGEEQAALAWGPRGTLAVEYPDMLRLWPDGIGRPSIDAPVVEQSARIAWTRDGRHVALPLSNGRVALVDPHKPTPDNTQYLPLPGASISAWSVVAPPKESQIIVSYSGGRIVRWNPDSGRIIARIPLPKTDRVAPIGLSVNPDESLLATTGGDHFIKLYDLARNVALPSLEIDASEAAGAIAFSPDGNFLAATGADNCIYLWKMGDSAHGRFLKIEPGSISDDDNWATEGFSGAIAWIGPRTLAVLASGGTVRILNFNETHWRARARALNLNYDIAPD